MYIDTSKYNIGVYLVSIGPIVNKNQKPSV